MSVRSHSKPANYVGSLDGLRAVCALGVIGYHMNLGWCQGGFLGVTVFLVLAGYLATSQLLREFDKKGSIDIIRYWKRRFWRIMPTAVVFVIVTAIACAIFNHVLLTKMRPDIAPALLMYINWAKIFANESYFVAQGAPSPLTHFWSLAIEFQFYILWPLVMYGLLKTKASKRSMGIGVFALAVASAVLMAYLYVPGEDPSRVYYGTDTRAFSMLLGSWLAFIWPCDKMSQRTLDSFKRPVQVLIRLLGVASLAALIVMMILAEGYSEWSYYGGLFLCSLVGVGAILALVPEGSLLRKFMGSKPMTWLGLRSYDIYVWHYPILELLNKRNATVAPEWWVYVLELILIIVVAHLSFTFVCQPMRKGWPTYVPGEQQGHGSKAIEARSKYLPPARKLPLRKILFKHKVPTLLFSAALIGCVACCIVVPPVTVMGNAPGDKVLTKATLKKPLVEGVYDVVFIGDSVALGMNEQLSQAFPKGIVDTEGGRQWYEALRTLQNYLDQGVVGDTIVFSIGTNGKMNDEEIDQIMEVVGPDRTMWFVNLRAPGRAYDNYNAAMDRAQERYDNVHIIDWHAATEYHDEYLLADGIHLSWDGRDAYVKLVLETMDYEIPNEYNTKYEVTVLGDLLCLLSANELSQMFPLWMIDAADGRTLQGVAEKINSYAEQDVLGDIVVVTVPVDEILHEGDLDPVFEAVGAEKTLYIVNGRIAQFWCKDNNEIIAKAVSEHPNAILIDWYTASTGHDDYYEEDGIYLTLLGQKAYAETIATSMGFSA